MPSNGPREPIIETPTHEPGQEETGDRALRLRVRQQEILAELGVTALKGTPFDDLLKEAVVLSAQGLEAEFCKVLEYIPAQNRFLMRAGVGWDEGLVGTASVGADLASPSGYALRTGRPVISNHLESEERFRTPDLLAAHGVRRAINVILQGDGAPYGVLEVDSRSAGEFSERDITFLQGAANILGMAIDRQRQEQALKVALEYQQVLLQEINHRVKNSLQLVAGMLRLQAGDDPHLGQRLQEASSRIMAIGRASCPIRLQEEPRCAASPVLRLAMAARCRFPDRSHLSLERPDCVAGHVGLELRNVGKNYLFEKSHTFPWAKPEFWPQRLFAF
jgi:GAF domain-containing protein/histidine kinase